jgi:hypothetical protein
MIGTSWLIHRNINQKVGGWDVDLSVHDDYLFFAKVAYMSTKIIYVDESIVYWRQDNLQSLSKIVTWEGMNSHLTVCNRLHDIVQKDLHINGVKQALAMEYSKLIYRAYPAYMDLVKEAEIKLKRLGYAEPLPMPTYKFRFFTKLFGFYPTVKLFVFKDKVAKMIKNKGLMQ